MARKKSSSKKKGPKTGALEKKVDAVLLTRGLSLDEDPEKLLEKSKRRKSKFQPGNPGWRKKKTSTSTTASKKTSSSKKKSSSKRKKSSATKKTKKQASSKKKSASNRKKSSPKKTKKKGKRKLTKKEIEQRKYAAKMKGVRKRAKETEGGSGPILEREAAKKLRKKHGLKNPRKE